VAAIAVYKVVGSPSDLISHLILGLTVVIAVVVPRKVATAILATGNEYYGLVRYLLKGDQKAEIHRYLSDVFGSVRGCHPAADMHLISFSFGCIITFDHLFGRVMEGEPEITLTSLAFIGFPYIIIDAGEPGYFSGRRWPKGLIERWENLYLADDVLGSKVGDHLEEIFGSKEIPLEEIRVAAQREIRSWANPITQHMAYWDPKADEPCEAIQHVARVMFRS
jgi:hypothetical protein